VCKIGCEIVCGWKNCTSDSEYYLTTKRQFYNHNLADQSHANSKLNLHAWRITFPAHQPACETNFTWWQIVK